MRFAIEHARTEAAVATAFDAVRRVPGVTAAMVERAQESVEMCVDRAWAAVVGGVFARDEIREDLRHVAQDLGAANAYRLAADEDRTAAAADRRGAAVDRRHARHARQQAFLDRSPQ